MAKPLIIVLLFATACATPQYGRYPSWEPTSPEVPTVPDRAQAKQWLRESREVWDAWKRTPLDLFRASGPSSGLFQYSYVRAVQRDEARVEFTVLGVEGDRVVLRALVEADPKRLEFKAPIERAMRSVWVERGSEVGLHEDGSPPSTVETLYAKCEEALNASTQAGPRIYFHPDGVLMHCGYLASECDDCGTISVHSYSTYPVTSMEPLDKPSCWLCNTAAGVVLPGARVYYESPELECGPPEKLPVSELGRRQWETLRRVPDRCQDACGRYCQFAGWRIAGMPPCFSWPTYANTGLSFLAIGKRTPRDDWTFPFVQGDGFECGMPRPTWRTVGPYSVKPELRGNERPSGRRRPLQGDK